MANSIMLTPVMEFNKLGNLDKFALIAEDIYRRMLQYLNFYPNIVD